MNPSPRPLHALRIVVADDEQDMRDYLKETLPELGHQVVAAASSGRQLVEACRAHRPDLIITDVRMPDGDGLQAIKELGGEHFAPVVLVTAHHDAEILKRSTEAHVFAYLVKPIERAHLESAIAIAWSRAEQFEKLKKETGDLRQALEDRKIIEKAKGILMKSAGMDEDSAFRRLQKLARDENRKLADVARMIVFAQKAMEPATEARPFQP